MTLGEFKVLASEVVRSMATLSSGNLDMGMEALSLTITLNISLEESYFLLRALTFWD